MILGLLPFLALVLACLTQAPALGQGSWRRGCLRAAVAWGAVSVLALELLSLAGAVSRLSVGVLWAGGTLLLLAGWWRRASRGGFPPALDGWKSRVQPWPLSLSVGAVLGITALVAWLAPPSTWDSLNYHLPRIAHWAQLGAVRHFPTGIEIQNSMSPGAEMLILPSYLLGQGDRWVNFVSWMAVAGSLLGVSAIAGELGAGRVGQWAAAAFGASLPTAIIQASSTMTDGVVALWVLVVALEWLHLRRAERVRWPDLAPVSAAAGLAVLTKPTAYAYLLPFALALGFDLLRRLGWRRTLGAGLLAFALVAVLNAGHWSRNYSLYGNPVSQPVRIEAHRSPWLGGRAFLSNLVRNAALHAGTPSPHVNKAIARGVQEIHRLLDLEVNESRTTATGQFKVRWSSTNEDKATNPIHAALILLSVGSGLLLRKRLPGPWLPYAGLATATFLVFSLLFQWQLFAGRYHVPFFLLMAPVVAVLAERSVRRSWLTWGMVGLVLLAAPWLLQIKSRPLLTWPGETYIDSIIRTDREELYFANGLYLREPYEQMARTIRESSCRQVGLELTGGQAEYPLWVLLDRPQDPTMIRWIVAGTESASLSDRFEDPCALICERCPQDSDVRSHLPLVDNFATFRLYLDPQAAGP